MKNNDPVLVIGGGLIGLCTAFSLLRSGRRVTIIERHQLGSGAARGNAGEVTPLTALPLAGPGMLGDVLKGVLTKQHYLSIAPLALPQLASFGLSFLAHCRERRVTKGTRALDQLVRGAFAAFDEYQSDGISVAGGGTGYIYAHPNVELLIAYRQRLVQRANLLGLQQPDPIHRGDEVQALEPALRRSVPAAFLAPSERFLDPRVFVDDLVSLLRSSGVEIHEGVEALRIVPEASRPTVVVRTIDGERRMWANRVVLAGGAWTNRILANSSKSAPRPIVVSGRGYSFTVRTGSMPSHLVGSLDQRTVAIPLSGRLRVVGLMDFDGSTDRFDQARFHHLASRAARFLDGVDWCDISDEWVGPRPMTPSGLPIISPLPQDDRIILATGHNMHGLSLGPVTGELIAQMIAGDTPTVAGAAIDLAPFSLASHPSTHSALRRRRKAPS